MLKLQPYYVIELSVMSSQSGRGALCRDVNRLSTDDAVNIVVGLIVSSCCR